MKKLIEAVEALPKYAGVIPEKTVVLDDVLRLIREHDPTAAIVAWLEGSAGAERVLAQGYFNMGLDTSGVYHRGRARALQEAADDLKSGKAGL